MGQQQKKGENVVFYAAHNIKTIIVADLSNTYHFYYNCLLSMSSIVLWKVVDIRNIVH